MFEEIFKRFCNSKITLLVKELKWDLEYKDRSERAKLLFVGTQYRLTLKIPKQNEILLAPSRYTPTCCKSTYELLETELFKNKSNISRIEGMRKMNPHMDDYSLRMAQDISRALQLWMVTVGTRIQINCFDDVQAIWQMLRDASYDSEAEITEWMASWPEEMYLMHSAFTGYQAGGFIDEMARIPKL